MGPALRRAFDDVAGGLQPLGFRKRRQGLFTVDLAPEVIGVVGLNTATKHLSGGARILPVMGVRHQDVKRVVAELRGKPFHSYVGATVSVPVHELTPDKQTPLHWILPSASVVEEIVRTVEEVGMPFLTEYADIERVPDAIARRWGHHLEYELPVVLRQLGRDEEAIAAADETLAGIEGQVDAGSETLRQFLLKFKALPPVRS